MPGFPTHQEANVTQAESKQEESKSDNIALDKLLANPASAGGP